MGCADSSLANTPLRGADASAVGDDTDEQQQKVTNLLHEDRLGFKFKRQNVFTAGVDVDEKVPNIKTIPKTDSQRTLIRKNLPPLPSLPHAP
jgi:hypothetical protein